MRLKCSVLEAFVKLQRAVKRYSLRTDSLFSCVNAGPRVFLLVCAPSIVILDVRLTFWRIKKYCNFDLTDHEEKH